MESVYEEFSEGISDPQIEPQKPSQKFIHTCSWTPQNVQRTWAQEGVYMEQELAKHQTVSKTKNPVGAGNTELKRILEL